MHQEEDVDWLLSKAAAIGSFFDVRAGEAPALLLKALDEKIEVSPQVKVFASSVPTVRC
jgi:hypothetical protein